MHWQSATSGVAVAVAVELARKPELPVERLRRIAEPDRTQTPGSADRRSFFRGLVIEVAVVRTAAQAIRNLCSDQSGLRLCCSKTARVGTARVGSARVGSDRAEQPADDRPRLMNSPRGTSASLQNCSPKADDAASRRCANSHVASAAGEQVGSANSDSATSDVRLRRSSCGTATVRVPDSHSVFASERWAARQRMSSRCYRPGSCPLN